MDRLTLTRILGSEPRIKKIDEISLNSRDSRLSKVSPSPRIILLSLPHPYCFGSSSHSTNYLEAPPNWPLQDNC